MKEADLLQEFALIALDYAIMFVLLAWCSWHCDRAVCFPRKRCANGHSLLVQIVVGVRATCILPLRRSTQGLQAGVLLVEPRAAAVALSLLAGPTAFQLYVMAQPRASNPLVQEPYQRIIWIDLQELSFCHALVSGALAIALIALAGVARPWPRCHYPRTFCDEIRSSEAELYLIAAMGAAARAVPALGILRGAWRAHASSAVGQAVKLRMQWLALWIALLSDLPHHLRRVLVGKTDGARCPYRPSQWRRPGLSSRW